MWAWGEDSNATDVDGNETNNDATTSGAAYVFTRTGAMWSQQAYLKASNTETIDQFGWSVGVSGDTVVVGARAEDSSAMSVNGDQTDNSAEHAGAAYVFVHDSLGWSQQAYLKASNAECDDEFGWSVAVSGDTVVVGAWREDGGATGVNGDQGDNSAPQAGAAYVFVRDGPAWSQEAYLKGSSSENGKDFGSSVAVSGDTAVVGAPGEDRNQGGINSGAAHVFGRNGSNWVHQARLAYLRVSGVYEPGSSALFGDSVAVSADTVAVGAQLEDSAATGVHGDPTDMSAPSSGAAFLFDY